MLYAETGLDMEKPEQTTLDFATVPHIAGVPRYMFRSAAKAVKDAIVAAIAGDPITSFDRELWLCFFAGVVKQRWKDRQRPYRTVNVATSGLWSDASTPISATVSTNSADSSVRPVPGR